MSAPRPAGRAQRAPPAPWGASPPGEEKGPNGRARGRPEGGNLGEEGACERSERGEQRSGAAGRAEAEVGGGGGGAALGRPERGGGDGERPVEAEL